MLGASVVSHPSGFLPRSEIMSPNSSAAFGAALLAALLVASASAQFTDDFETHVAAPTGVPNAGQNGWFVPTVANSVDTNAYTYAGNVLGFPPNPAGGGLNFAGGTNSGGVFNTRMEHGFGTPPFSGIWSAQFDICVDFQSAAYPAVQNIGSFSLQPSATARHFIALATWDTPIPAASAPTGWTLDFLFFDAAGGTTQVQASVGNTGLGYPTGGAGLPTCFRNLRLRTWYQVKVWWDWGTNSLVRVSLKDLAYGWQGFINLPLPGVPQWSLLGGANNVGLYPDPTNIRCFIGGATAGNTAVFDNLGVLADVMPPLGNEYQVNQPGIASANLNGAIGTATCPGLTVSSNSGGTLLSLAMDGGAPYDLAIYFGPALPASNPFAITLPDGQIFSLDIATTSFLCPGGPAPCLGGPVTLYFGAPLAGLIVTGQVVVFGGGALGISLSQPFTLFAEI
jgi:hypothetical protein